MICRATKGKFSSFDDMLASYDTVLLDAYATWCGPCQVRIARVCRSLCAHLAYSVSRAVHGHPALAKRCRSQNHGRADNQAGYGEVPSRRLAAWGGRAADADPVQAGKGCGKGRGRISESEGSRAVGEIESSVMVEDGVDQFTVLECMHALC